MSLTPSDSSDRSVDDPASLIGSATTPDSRRARRQAAQGPSHRSRNIKIGLLSVLVVVLVLVLGTAGVGLWLRHTLQSNIETIADPFAALPSRAPVQTVPEGEEPAVNILVLGSDSRISAGDPSQWQAGAQRTDAMMLVQVSGDRQDVSVMSFPRDSWVAIPGHGEAKINAAYSFGGPTLTIQTVEQLTGVHIDHFVIADFESFKTLTDEIGGVTINLKNDQTIAGEQFSAGAQHLNGEQALAYARERKHLPRGDFDRVNRQQAWMRAIVAQTLNNGTLSSPAKLYGFLNAVTSTMAVDSGFTMDEMQSLALSMRGLHSTDIAFMQVPTSGTGTSADGQSVVLLNPDADEPLYEAFRTDSVHDYLEAHPDAVEQLPSTVS